MSTNIAALKGKGLPPVVEAATDVVADNTRAEDTSTRALQFKVTDAVFQEFGEQAGREFGFNKGAKSSLFLKMWKAYKAQNMKAR